MPQGENMESLNYILFICVTIPLVLLLFLLERKARLIVEFVLAGIFMCLFVSEVNGLLRAPFNYDMFYITTTITPITEEIAKAIPVLFFALAISDDRRTLISVSIATGIGFAILENLIILIGSIDSVSLLWALSRGFGAALMHGICTAAIGIGISFVLKKRKLFFVGTFALFVVAVIYHATFNLLVQSNIEYVGTLLPILTYIPIIYFINKSRKKANAVPQAKENAA